MHILREVSTVKVAMTRLLAGMFLSLGLHASIAGAQMRSVSDRPGVVKVEYDRFENETMVRLDLELEQAGLNLITFFTMLGRSASRPELVVMTLVAKNESWEFLRCHDVSFLVDGVPFASGASEEPHHNGEVGTGYVLEFIAVMLTPERFNLLIGGSKIEGRLCRTEFGITPPQLASLRDFATRMNP